MSAPSPAAPLPRVPLDRVVGRLVRSRLQVGFTRCDPYGHMNTAAFLAEAIDHRMTEVLQLIGLDTLRQAEEDGIVYLIRKVEMELLAPAPHGAWLTVESWIDAVRPSAMEVVVRFLREDGGARVAQVVFTAATFHRGRGVLVQIPADYPCVDPTVLEGLPWAEGHPRGDAG